MASGTTADGNSWLEWDFGAVQPIRGLVFMPILARDNLPKWSVLVSRTPLRASGVIPALGTVSYSGVVVVQGQFPAGTMPLFADGRHRNGTWGGLSFINLVDNPDGGVGWPMFTGFSDRGLNRRLYSLLDLERTMPAYFIGLRAISKTPCWKVSKREVSRCLVRRQKIQHGRSHLLCFRVRWCFALSR